MQNDTIWDTQVMSGEEKGNYLFVGLGYPGEQRQ
jgi:hypothetical protein